MRARISVVGMVGVVWGVRSSRREWGGQTKQNNAMIYLGIEPQRPPQHGGNEVPSYSSPKLVPN